MTNTTTLLILMLLFQSCKTKQQEDAETLNDTGSKYETYNYTGFTKEEKYAIHKHIYEGGDWFVQGNIERYFHLNFSEVSKHSHISPPDMPKILEETPRDDVKNFITSKDLTKGGGLTLNDYVQQVEVNGLIIIHQGKIVFEGYPRMFPTDLHVAFVIIQTFVSTAIAILEDRGLLDTNKSIDHYFTILKSSGWEGVTIRDILSMSSGIDAPFETHLDSLNPIQGLATAKFVSPPGIKHKYSTVDAALLMLLVEKISGLTFKDFVEREIWGKIGAKHSALMGINTNGRANGFDMSTTLRDLARFGLAFTPSGRKSTHPLISDMHLSKIRDVNKKLEKTSRSSGEKYYSSYQWAAVYEDGDLYKSAHGGQGLYVSPEKDLVIAFFGTANTDREINQLSIISRQLAKSGLFDLE